MGATESIETMRDAGEFALSEQEADFFEKFVLWHGAHDFEGIDCKKVIERRFPGVLHEIGVPDDLPEFECYLLGAEMFSQVLESENREHDEVLV